MLLLASSGVVADPGVDLRDLRSRMVNPERGQPATRILGRITEARVSA